MDVVDEAEVVVGDEEGVGGDAKDAAGAAVVVGEETGEERLRRAAGEREAYFFRRYAASAWIALATILVLLVYKISVISR